MSPSFSLCTRPRAAVKDFKSLGKTYKLPCMGDCSLLSLPTRLQREMCFFSPVTVFINTAVLKLFYPFPSFLLSLRRVLTLAHTHNKGCRWSNRRKALVIREGIQNHRIMLNKRVSFDSSKEGPGPKSDQAARDHIQLTSKQTHRQIFHRNMQKLKPLIWYVDQGLKGDRPLSPILSAVLLLCTASYFLPLLNWVLLNTISAVIFPCFMATIPCSSWQLPRQHPSSLQTRVPSALPPGITMALATSDWILKRPNQLPLTAASSLMEERRIKGC